MLLSILFVYSFYTILTTLSCVNAIGSYKVNNLQHLLHANASNLIPKLLFQMYHNKSQIPSKVATNLAKYAKEHHRILLDDGDCVRFLTQYFDASVVETFHKLGKQPWGAFKSDYVRYALLYIYGRVYLDIKIELIQPIDSLFRELSEYPVLYTVLSLLGKSMFQGVLAAPPRHWIFLELMHHYRIVLEKPILEDHLLISCFHMYDLIVADMGQHQLAQKTLLTPGLHFVKKNIFTTTSSLVNTTKEVIGAGYYLYQELQSPVSDCPDGKDRHAACSYIYDGAWDKMSNNDAPLWNPRSKEFTYNPQHHQKILRKVIKTRYADYPDGWK